MIRLTAKQILLRNLQQRIPQQHKRLYMTREEAYEMLKERTGQDFGYDVDAWKKWLKANPKTL